MAFPDGKCVEGKSLEPCLAVTGPFVLPNRLVFEMANTAAVFGDDVTVPAELVFVGG